VHTPNETRQQVPVRDADRFVQDHAVSDGVDDVLLDTAIHPPRVGAGLIERTKLVDLLMAQEKVPLVVLSAPVGYGKRSLLAQWDLEDDRPFVWVSLSPGDGDPVRLLTLVGHAVGRCLDIDPARFKTGTPGISVMGQVVPRLIAALQSASAPMVLVIRNLHEVSDQLGRDALDLLADHLPPGVQLVCSSRGPVWLATPARRAHGQILELGSADLQFDGDEVARLLQTTAQTDDADVLDGVMRSTEGWAAGVYLSGLALQRRSASPIRPLPGDTVEAVDLTTEFVRSEVLAELDTDVVRFLQRAAVLDVMSGPLCDAVLRVEGSDEILHSISRSNLLVVPIDASGSWYRSHMLLRTALLDELAEQEPDLVSVLHERASRWWENHGSMSQAISHALSSRDTARAGTLAARGIIPAYYSGRLHEIQTWLAGIGDDGIEAHPTLAVLAGWIAALTGQSVEATRCLASVDHLDEVPESSSVVPSLASNRAALRGFLCEHGVEAMARDAELADSLEPVWSPWKTVTLGLLATSRWMQGDLDDALLDYAESIDVAEQTQAWVPMTRMLALRAVLEMDLDDWDAAAKDVDRSLAVIDGHDLSEYAASATTYAAAARLSLHHGDHAAARAALVPAMKLREQVSWATPWASVVLRLQLANALLALDDPRGARIILREIEDVLHHRPELGAFNDQVDRLSDRLAAARMGTPTTTLSGAELGLLPYLQTHLTLAEIAERLYVSRHTVATHTKSIYRKFGVSSRGEAVEHAREVGLLVAPGLA